MRGNIGKELHNEQITVFQSKNRLRHTQIGILARLASNNHTNNCFSFLHNSNYISYQLWKITSLTQLLDNINNGRRLIRWKFHLLNVVKVTGIELWRSSIKMYEVNWQGNWTHLNIPCLERATSRNKYSFPQILFKWPRLHSYVGWHYIRKG